MLTERQLRKLLLRRAYQATCRGVIRQVEEQQWPFLRPDAAVLDVKNIPWQRSGFSLTRLGSADSSAREKVDTLRFLVPAIA
jgi:hypothetical protein